MTRFALCALLALALGLARSPVAGVAQAVPTTLPTTTTIPTTVSITTTIPGFATTVPTTYPTTVATTYPTVLPGTPPPQGVSLFGCAVFPPNDPTYNTRIDNLPPDPQSAAFMASYLAYLEQKKADRNMSLSYGDATWFINRADADTPKHPVMDVSTDRPVPVNPPINDFPFLEHMAWQGKDRTYSGDRHLMVLDATTCIEYEAYVSGVEPPLTWRVIDNQLQQRSRYAVRFDLNAPYPLTAARGNGVNLGRIPQFAGLIRWEDWQSGCICHALNINVHVHSMGNSVPPAYADTQPSYFQGTVGPPISTGIHFRLKASYTLACTCPQAQMIVRAMKDYGAYMMDQGTPAGTLYLANYYEHDHWVVPWDIEDVLHIHTIPISELEIVAPPGCATVAACYRFPVTP